MKIIFLDCDGVLNYDIWYRTDRYKNLPNDKDSDIDPLCVKRVNRLAKKTGASVVISSSWKISEYYKERLTRAGIKNIIGKTPDLIWGPHRYYSRGNEIDEYLQYHPEVTNYVILDDAEDMNEHQLPHYVHINPYCGLTVDDIKLAASILEKD